MVVNTKIPVQCPKCNWQGLSGKLEFEFDEKDLIYYMCPTCKTKIEPPEEPIKKTQ